MKIAIALCLWPFVMAIVLAVGTFIVVRFAVAFVEDLIHTNN